MWDYRRSLADIVNRARTQKGLTKRYVSEIIGTDARTISNIEKCKSNTTLDVLCPLLELLDIDPREALRPWPLRKFCVSDFRQKQEYHM